MSGGGEKREGEHTNFQTDMQIEREVGEKRVVKRTAGPSISEFSKDERIEKTKGRKKRGRVGV